MSGAGASGYRLGAPALAVGGAVGVGVVGAWAFGAACGWAQGGELVSAVLLVAGVWVVAAVLGLAVLLGLTRGEVERLGFGVLGSSMVRLIGAMGLGLGAFVALDPEGRTFWVGFLAAGLLALAAETVWAVRELRKAAGGVAAMNGVG